MKNAHHRRDWSLLLGIVAAGVLVMTAQMSGAEEPEGGVPLDPAPAAATTPAMKVDADVGEPPTSNGSTPRTSDAGATALETPPESRPVPAPTGGAAASAPVPTQVTVARPSSNQAPTGNLPARTRAMAPPRLPSLPTHAPSEVAIRLLVEPAGIAHAFWGAKDLGVAPLDIIRPRDSGPLDLVVRASGYLTFHTRAYTDRDDKIAIRMVPTAQAPSAFGYRASAAPAVRPESQKPRRSDVPRPELDAQRGRAR